MSAATQFPANIFIGQWQTKDYPNPRLAAPIVSTDTSFAVTAPLLDDNGDPVTGNFIGGFKNASGYVESWYAPAGSSTDGQNFTGIVRGIRLSGYDYTTGDADLAADFEQDSAVYCNISAVLFQMMIGAMTGAIASGGLNWKIGDGTDGNIRVTAYNADGSKPYFEYNASSNQWIYSNDGVSSTPFGTGAGVTGGDGITVTAGDIDIDLTDTTIFKQTSAGVSDAGKVPRLDANGQLDASFIDDADVSVSNFGTSGTANTTTTDKYALAWNGNTRLDLADANEAALNAPWLLAGIANGASTSGNAQNYYPLGPIVDVPAFTLSQRAGCRLWDGETNSTSNTTTDTIGATTQWRAQVFVPQTGQDNVGKVILNMTNSSMSGTGSCQIYAVTGTAPSQTPTGAALGTSASVTSWSSGDIEFTFTTPVSVTPGTSYAVVFRLTAFTSGTIAWNYNNSSVYANGNSATSSNSGGAWTAESTFDRRFKVQYRGIAGEPVFLSDTAGTLDLSPGTYTSVIGHAVSTTQVMLMRGIKMIYATFGATLSAAGTTDTEITVGFRPLMVWGKAKVADAYEAYGDLYWMNASTPNVSSKGQIVALDTGTSATGSKVQVENLTGQIQENSRTNFYLSSFTIQANSANTITCRRVVAGSTNNTTFNAYLYIIGY